MFRFLRFPDPNHALSVDEARSFGADAKRHKITGFLLLVQVVQAISKFLEEVEK